MANDLIPVFDADYWRAEIARDPRLKSEHTRRGYLADLAAFETWRAGRLASKLLIEQYAAEMQDAGLSPTTINRKLSAIRWYARRAADLAQEYSGLEDPQAHALIAQAERIASIKNVRGNRPQKGRHIAPGELAALIATCENDPTPAGLRDAALIALAWSTGARRAELAGVTLGDWTPGPEGDGDLTIRGKGDKSRSAYVYNGAFAALSDWLQERGSEPGPVFCRIDKGGKIAPFEYLSGEAMRKLLYRRRAQARVQALTWHDFRRTFAGNLLDNAQDLVTVQKLMGHSSPTTTANYDRRGEETRRAAIKTLHVPYRGRLVK